jgi:hypothetical protein
VAALALAVGGPVPLSSVGSRALFLVACAESSAAQDQGTVDNRKLD